LIWKRKMKRFAALGMVLQTYKNFGTLTMEKHFLLGQKCNSRNFKEYIDVNWELSIKSYFIRIVSIKPSFYPYCIRKTYFLSVLYP
jgi:hypothetical protein